MYYINWHIDKVVPIIKKIHRPTNDAANYTNYINRYLYRDDGEPCDWIVSDYEK